MMGDIRKIKDIYGCVAIISDDELYPLQKWYNQVIEKTIQEITAADILKMMRQKCFINLAMSKAIELLKNNVFIGETYDGELIKKISELDSTLLLSFANDLRSIIKIAKDESFVHEWSYRGEAGEFNEIVNTLEQKLNNSSRNQ